MRTGMSLSARATFVSKPTLPLAKSPTTQMMHMFSSISTVPYFFSSPTMSVRWVGLSIVTLTPTSLVQTMSMLVL